MKITIFILLTILSACDKWDVVTYKLSNGTIVQCSELTETPCGLNLTDCEDSEEYLCQKNIVVVSRHN